MIKRQTKSVQAPVHTDSLTVYETTLRVIPTDEGEGAEIRRPIVEAKAVIEQRISHFVMGLAIIGTMTGPLLIVLHTMPTAVFAGVFFTVGWGSIESNGMVQKTIFLMRENRFVQRDEPLLTVRKRKILLFIVLQGIGVAATVAISQTIAAIGSFPQRNSPTPYYTPSVACPDADLRTCGQGSPC